MTTPGSVHPFSEDAPAADFIRAIVTDDIRAGKNGGRVATRFPPEPNGYLHIGHAKSICLNFGVAAEFGGICNLRFDDTNPTKEDIEYVESIEEDVRWLGFQWDGEPRFASDYFTTLYDYAVHLIREGKAYVDSLNAEEMREYRGTLTQPGRESPYRNRSVEENLDLFRRMRDGEFADGEHVLRARIDMASPNINMRDPVLYRIRRAHHHRTGDTWCIYPMYDFAHPPSDALEHIRAPDLTAHQDALDQALEYQIEGERRVGPADIECQPFHILGELEPFRGSGIPDQLRDVDGEFAHFTQCVQPLGCHPREG